MALDPPPTESDATMTTTRAFLRFDALLAAGPADGPTFACTHCGGEVESVDGRGRCDDCGADRLLALLDEAATADVDVAVVVGRLCFDRRDAARCEAELTADPAFLAWCDAQRDAAMVDQLAEERPLAHRTAA